MTKHAGWWSVVRIGQSMATDYFMEKDRAIEEFEVYARIARHKFVFLFNGSGDLQRSWDWHTCTTTLHVQPIPAGRERVKGVVSPERRDVKLTGCPVCHGSGDRVIGSYSHPCDACHGTGRVSYDFARDYIWNKSKGDISMQSRREEAERRKVFAPLSDEEFISLYDKINFHAERAINRIAAIQRNRRYSVDDAFYPTSPYRIEPDPRRTSPLYGGGNCATLARTLGRDRHSPPQDYERFR